MQNDNWYKIKVDSYSGYKSDQYPLKIYQSRTSSSPRKVLTLLEQWQELDARTGRRSDYFRVLIAGCGEALIRFHRAENVWEMKNIT